MIKLLTLALILCSFSTYSQDLGLLLNTKQHVKQELWNNGIVQNKYSKIPITHKNETKNLPEELLIPLIKLERVLNISGQS